MNLESSDKDDDHFANEQPFILLPMFESRKYRRFIFVIPSGFAEEGAVQQRTCRAQKNLGKTVATTAHPDSPTDEGLCVQSAQSWLCGKVLAYFEPEAVALFASRGHQSPRGKALMRWTVVVADALGATLRCFRTRCLASYYADCLPGRLLSMIAQTSLDLHFESA